MSVTWRHRGEYAAFRLAVCLIECLPVRTAARLADGLAWLFHAVLPRKLTRFAVAKENLQRAFGNDIPDAEIERLTIGMWRHLFRMVIELVQSQRKLSVETYRQYVRFVALEMTNEALLSGRPVLLLSGHFGNWEVGVALFGSWGFPLGVVAREMDNPLLDAWFQRYRAASRHRLLSKNDGYDDMLEVLRQGGNLALLCDQDAGPRGLFVDFFGHPASTFKSIALLALEYDALLVVGNTRRLPDAFGEVPWSQFEVRGEVLIDPREISSNDPVGELTRRYTAALEQAIRRQPDQYFWVHRRWKSVPKQRNKPTTEAVGQAS